MMSSSTDYTEAGEDRAVAESPDPTGLNRLLSKVNPHYLVLFLLPWLIFLINPNWLFQGFGRTEPWHYFGMSIHYPQFQPFVQLAGERPLWVLPARLLVALFSPAYGWVALHL